MNKFYVFFVITLICTLPVHHAHALSVKVSGNTGNAGVDGYLNGNSDVWELTTTLTNLEYPPVPEQVFLEIGSASTPFTSCSGDGTSAECKFISDLSDGIEEGSYDFKVAVYDAEDVGNETVIGDTELGSDTENVYVDGSKPVISFLDAHQTGQDIKLDFVAYDPNTCSGLKLVEVYNNDGGEVLDSITFDEPGTCEYSYETGNRAGQLPASLDEQGSTQLRVRATDWMGMQGVSNIQYFTRDFVVPTVSSVGFPGTSSIGDKEISVDVQVNVTECSGLTEVLVVSEQINFKSLPGDVDYKGDCHYEVMWTDLSFTPSGSSVTMTVVMQDQYGNIGEDVESYTFDRDTTAPEIEFFGTRYVYEDVSYMADDSVTDVIAQITETGSGLDLSGVLASFSALGRDGFINPDYCVNESSLYTCVWEDISADGDGTRAEEIRLVQVVDRAGNDYGTHTIPLVIDSIGPSVLDFNVIAISEYGEFESFKSGDDLIIQLEVSEASGLNAKIDVHDLVMDAEVRYDYGQDPYNPDKANEDNGYAMFSNDQCSRNDQGNWDCEFIIENIRTGYVSSAGFDILLYDTAGNPVQEWLDEPENIDCLDGDCSVEIFAADYDTVPDLWEQGSINSDHYVLLDIADATYPRQQFDVRLRSEGAILENQILQSCSAPDGAPPVNRPVLLGGIGSGSPEMTLVMELQSFDPSLIVNKEGEFTQVELEYNCTVLLFSSRGGVTYTTPEEQTINVPMTFGYSEVGSLDEQVPALIDEMRDSGLHKFLRGVNKVANVVKVVEKAYDVLKTLGTIVNIFKTAKSTVTVASCNAERAGSMGASSTCEGAVGFCNAMEQAIMPGQQFMNVLTGVMGILFCDAQPVTINYGDMPSWRETEDSIKASMTAKERPNTESGDAQSSGAAPSEAPSEPALTGAAPDRGEGAVGAAAESAKDGGKRSGEGAAKAIDVIAAVKTYQVAIVTAWAFLKGQWFTGIFFSKTRDKNFGELDDIVSSGFVNDLQKESLQYEQELGAIHGDKEKLTADTKTYMGWLDELAGLEEYSVADQDRIYGMMREEGITCSDGTNSGPEHCTRKDVLSAVGEANQDLEQINAGQDLIERGISASLYDNYIVSFIGVCIPGVLYNFQKLYVIQCAYMNCLENDVAAGLATIDSCTGTYNYATCKFWYGEVLGQILGFIGNIIKGLGDIVVSIISDPFSVIMIGLNIACSQVGCQSVRADQGVVLGLCQAYQVVGQLNSVAQQVKGYIDFAQNHQEMLSSCDEVEESLEQTVEGETTVSEESETETTGTTTVSEQ